MTPQTKPGLKPMLRAYIECALWSSTGPDDTPLDQCEAELSPEAQAQMEKDCANFMDYCQETIGDDWHAGQTFEQIGHDFWLTRNRNGAGFWDRGLGALGDRLIQASKTFGSCELYVGDNGLIYGHLNPAPCGNVEGENMTNQVIPQPDKPENEPEPDSLPGADMVFGDS